MDPKSSIYSIARSIGLFRITRMLTGYGVRVLCYHGVVPDDDDLAEFHPKLFMRRDTLTRRLDYVLRSRLTVLSLDDALERILSGVDVRNSVVLTFDDGWHGTFEYGIPLLLERRMPCTVYVSSYYSGTGRPVFNVALQYIFWKGTRAPIDLRETQFQADSEMPLYFPNSAGNEALAALTDLGHRLAGERRFALLCHLATIFGPAAMHAVTSRRLTSATIEELRRLRNPLVSLQLHTHRHVAPESSRSAFVREVTDNRNVLKAAGATSLRHFCYPSGRFALQHFDWLKELGVDSASTTIPGRWTSASNQYLIPRFVDSDAYSDVLFEAEISGLQELLRSVRHLLTPKWPR
jgi:peptidoglycan/xylan/chitin deacetylase (PgdA/CDA1 family)